MRIIAGDLKGRKIFDPVDNLTRPLKDMVRESIFNILEHSKFINTKLKGINILDLYSGVGSFGLECLSRGSKKVFFFEKHLPTLNILKKNIKIFNFENKCEIIESDVINIKKFDQLLNLQFNLVFLDPPFKDTNLNEIIDMIFEMKILTENSYIIIHRNKKIKEKFTDKLKEIRVETYGKSKIIFGTISN